MAVSVRRAGRPGDAVPLFERALEIAEAKLGADDVGVSVTFRTIAPSPAPHVGCCDRLPPNTKSPLVPSAGYTASRWQVSTQRLGQRKALWADSFLPGTAGQGRCMWSRRHQRPRRARCLRRGDVKGEAVDGQQRELPHVARRLKRPHI